MSERVKESQGWSGRVKGVSVRDREEPASVTGSFGMNQVGSKPIRKMANCQGSVRRKKVVFAICSQNLLLLQGTWIQGLGIHIFINLILREVKKKLHGAYCMTAAV